ncbi:MAG: YlmC/YmxH family sporulation protein [Oscillospiraceae bacterium]|nr:YlmC/YmxH family sporulation protein [Oscillospiraceae bacterium]
MLCKYSDLRCKEVVNIATGARLGYVSDAEIDLSDGKICALIVPGPARFFGLFGRGEDQILPWNCIRRFGSDIILVERDVPPPPPPRPQREHRCRWF